MRHSAKNIYKSSIPSLLGFYPEMHSAVLSNPKAKTKGYYRVPLSALNFIWTKYREV